MTLLVASISAKRLEELKADVARAWTGGADAVELRLDTYEDSLHPLGEYMAAQPDRVWIVTCRSASEGGLSGDTAVQRAERLAQISSDTGAWIDFELADWRRSGRIQGLLAAAARNARSGSGRLILSAHNFDGPLENMPQLMKEMMRAGAIAKVAYQARDVCESFPALDAMADHKGRAIAIAMGEPGQWSRVLAGKLGALASYCYLPDRSETREPLIEGGAPRGLKLAARDGATAPGQLTLSEMTAELRWRDINAETHIYGVLGDPVGHSLSPLLFNHWFAEMHVNAVYLPIRVGRDGACLGRFLSGCLERPWLDVRGFSVTLPHKTAALSWVGDGADERSKSIGAINTLAWRGREVSGTNTDCDASIESLVAALGCEQVDLAGVPIDVLGCGGAARAVLAGLRDAGARVAVYGRSPERTSEVARVFDATPRPWGERGRHDGDLLINCTSVGLKPDVSDSPMPADRLGGYRLVFDLIYNPLETQLLRDARSAGVATLGGLDMFVRQAAAQFVRWTSRTPDLDAGVSVILRAIESRAEGGS